MSQDDVVVAARAHLDRRRAMVALLGGARFLFPYELFIMQLADYTEIGRRHSVDCPAHTSRHLTGNMVLVAPPSLEISEGKPVVRHGCGLFPSAAALELAREARADHAALHLIIEQALVELQQCDAETRW